jgi:hypothetical protein
LKINFPIEFQEIIKDLYQNGNKPSSDYSTKKPSKIRKILNKNDLLSFNKAEKSIKSIETVVYSTLKEYFVSFKLVSANIKKSWNRAGKCRKSHTKNCKNKYLNFTVLIFIIAFIVV